MNSAIVTEHLVVVRGGRPILRDVSLQVATGSVTGLLGPSGSGKTTLMRAIVGAQRISGGSITVLGRPAGDRVLRSQIGYVTQAPSVYGDLSVTENLRYFARIVDAGDERIAAVLTTVGLDRHAQRLVATLSGGERARVSLATALLHEPPLLILDEPTVGLDPLLREELWATFHDVAHQGGTLLISSHSMEEAEECDALLLLREGALLAADTPDGLRARTGEHDLGRAFVRLVTDQQRAAAA
ncbi:MAG TPA: heme ABC exporter ATP-binding protein CcmA [Solirubrobacteraceae bacterium]